MPRVDHDDQAVWESLYSCYGENMSGPHHFVREYRSQYLGKDHIRLKDALDIKAGEGIVLIGGAFGWVGEDWLALGLGPIAVCDTSKWIHANKKDHAQIPILNEHALDAPSHGRIKAALGIEPTWAISEDVLPALDDAECLALSASMRKLAPKVVHWLTPAEMELGQDPRLNWKTLEDWKALVAPDAVASRDSRMVL